MSFIPVHAGPGAPYGRNIDGDTHTGFPSPRVRTHSSAAAASATGECPLAEFARLASTSAEDSGEARRMSLMKWPDPIFQAWPLRAATSHDSKPNVASNATRAESATWANPEATSFKPIP